VFYNFVFRNAHTGKTRAAIATDFMSAAGSLGIPVTRDAFGDDVILAPWGRWECWSALGECLWHFDLEGAFHLGPRALS
jgi:hypothetical protein